MLEIDKLFDRLKAVEAEFERLESEGDELEIKNYELKEELEEVQAELTTAQSDRALLLNLLGITDRDFELRKSKLELEAGVNAYRSHR